MAVLGMLDSLDAAADIVQVTHTETPDPSEAETYALLLPVFDDAYEALTPTFHALADSADRLPLRGPTGRLTAAGAPGHPPTFRGSEGSHPAPGVP
jgi:hypothetical protein